MTTGPLSIALDAYLQLPAFAGMSDHMRKQIRRAFFGGAQTLLASLNGATPAMVMTLCAEIELHFAEVEAGKA